MTSCRRAISPTCKSKSRKSKSVKRKGKLFSEKVLKTLSGTSLGKTVGLGIVNSDAVHLLFLVFNCPNIPNPKMQTMCVLFNPPCCLISIIMKAAAVCGAAGVT